MLEDLSAFAALAERTSLYLRQAIDETVENLKVNEDLARATSAAAALLARKISAGTPQPEVFIDPEDVAIRGIERGYKSLEEFLPSLVLNKSVVDQDGGLHGDRGRFLQAAYERCIVAVSGLIESMKDMRAAIITHDLAAESKIRESLRSALAHTTLYPDSGCRG